MLDKAAINKTIERFYNIKRPNRIQREANEKLKSLTKLPSSTVDLKPVKKFKKKNFFEPMNNFISVTSNHLDVPDLYKLKIIPSHSLETSKKVINRLTRRVYFSVKNKHNEIFLEKMGKDCVPVNRKKKKNRESLSFTMTEKNQSFEKLNKNCDELVKDNKKVLNYFYRKRKVLNKEVRSTQNLVEKLKSVKDDKELLEFSNGLFQCHSLLTKLDLIKPKSRGMVGS